MLSEVPSSAYVMSGVALLTLPFLVPYARSSWPRLKVRTHVEKHHSIRVVDLGLIVFWPRAPRRVTTAQSKGWELAFYVTFRV